MKRIVVTVSVPFLVDYRDVHNIEDAIAILMPRIRTIAAPIDLEGITVQAVIETESN